MSKKSATPAAGKAVLATGIDATISGEKRRCEIHRSDLRFFEAANGPALRIMNAIRSLEWDVELIRAIIEFASLPRPSDDNIDLYRMSHMTTRSMRRQATEWIDEAFVKNGPVRYVALALGILGAALVGLPQEDATFDDEALDG